MRFYLHQIRINQAGYDDRGKYWGQVIGRRLYWCSNGSIDKYLRASNRTHAMTQVQTEYPGACFFAGGLKGRA